MAEFFDQSTEGMKTCDGPAFNGSNKEGIAVILMIVDKVLGGLFSWDGDERDAFVGRLEPDNFWFLLLLVVLRLGRGFAASETFLLLLLLCRGRRWT